MKQKTFNEETGDNEVYLKTQLLTSEINEALHLIGTSSLSGRKV